MSFQTIFEACPDALIVVDADGKITQINRQAEKSFGYQREELVGQTIECLVPERLRGRHLDQRARFQQSPHLRPMGTGVALFGCRKDGSEFPLDILLSPMEWRGGKQVLAAIRDVSERNAVLAALYEARERSRVTLESIADAVLSVDTDGRILYLNKAAERIVGRPSDALVGQPLGRAFQLVEEGSREPVRIPFSLEIAEPAAGGRVAHAILTREGASDVPIEYSVAPILDAANRATGVVIVFRDITTLREFTRQITHLAQHDFLTNLPNRMLLNDRLGQAIGLAQRGGAQLAVLFLDLDHFKHINDSLGHGIGDRLLQSTAQRLTACVRSSDTVARIGGDEFVVLLAHVECAVDAAVSAQKLLAALAEPHLIEGHQLRLSTSIGISIYPGDGEDAETLITNADRAMFHAKDSGRNNIQFFTAGMDMGSTERHVVECDLRRALDSGEFELYYQPKINLPSGMTVGAEALIRWRHPQRGLVPPEEFLSIAEDSGLIVPLGRWTIRTVCQQLQAWQAFGIALVPVSVNISWPELRHPDFLRDVREILLQTQVEPRYLEFEVTESVLMHDAESAIFLLGELKKLGVRLSIDDFGAGFSSLSQLSRYSIDAVKIDQSFVHGLMVDAANARIVSAVIGMCEGLQCEVVAEGVETADEATLLLAHSCVQMQGFHFGRPMSAADLRQRLGTSNTLAATPLHP